MADEVIWRWDSIEKLLWALTNSEPPREGYPDEGGVTTVPSGPRIEVRSIREWDCISNGRHRRILQRMEFSFVGGIGNAIAFPLRLVSNTKIDEEVLPGDVFADLFGVRPDP